jgi:hypothetical protein
MRLAEEGGYEVALAGHDIAVNCQRMRKEAEDRNNKAPQRNTKNKIKMKLLYKNYGTNEKPSGHDDDADDDHGNDSKK